MSDTTKFTKLSSEKCEIKNTEEEEREKELKPIKELSSDKEDQVAKDHKYQSIHKKEKYPKGKSIFLKVIILVFTVT